jgi:hypothetical protein
MKSVRHLIAAGTVTVLAFALGGCAILGGIMTDSSDQVLVPPAEFSTKTDIQILDDALAHTDDLVQLLGGEWLDPGVPPGVFDRSDRAGWSSGPCGADNSNQYSINVRQVAPVAAPLAKIEQVREHWISLGYQIRQIGSTETDPEKYTAIFVDLPYGAGLGFHASTEMMGISTQSECIIEE